MSSLVDAIAEKLTPEAIRLATEVKRLTPQGRRWLLELAGGRPEEFDAVVIAAPSHAAAELLRPHDEKLADELGSITHSGTAIVSFGFDREQIGHPLDGMGIVVPAVENSPILACSLSSRKYPHRAPEGKVLLRVFVGGSRWPELATMDESELTPWILGELAKLLDIDGQPLYTSMARWPRSMPQYHVGHKQLVARIEHRMTDIAGIELAGNAYRGVGIPDCINYAQQAVERILHNP